MRSIGVAILLALAVASSARASALGSSGALTVPDPETLPREEYQLQIYGELFDETNLNTGALANTADVTFVANAGIYDNFELGVRQVARQNSPLANESFQLTGKYRFPVDTYNITLGGVLATSAPDWSSVYLTAGWKSLWFGFGINVGGRDIREVTRNNLSQVGFASFGGYNVRTGRNARGEQVVTGHPDRNVKLSESLRALADFDGDRFSGGVRFNMKDFNLDVAYVSQREKDTLLGRNTQNVQVGAGVKF
jgi:hypothetical protein